MESIQGSIKEVLQLPYSYKTSLINKLERIMAI